MRYVVFVCLFLSFSLHADELSSMYTSLKSKLASPALLKEAITIGDERAVVCKFCHGNNGNSKRDYIPNLADQNPKYLLKQFEMFATKQRDDKIMSELAMNLSSEDRVNIALFYSSKKAKPGPVLQPELKAKGKEIFELKCVACHASNGHGKEELPRVASQPTEYLKRTLDNYRTNPNRRPNSPMQAIVAALTEPDQAAVISFVSAMR
ncbi:MAG: cytochrome c4 [Gammaproteobacteria bacterium]|nr:cytochrome c4 [Gammaproteobacteria bacterium]